MQNAARVLERFQPSVANSQQNVRARSLRKSCSLRWPREFTCCTNRWCMRCGHRTRFRARLHSRFIYLRTWRGGPMRLENAGERQKLPYRHGLQRWICPGWVQRWRTCRAMNMVEPVFFSFNFLSTLPHRVRWFRWRVVWTNVHKAIVCRLELWPVNKWAAIDQRDVMIDNILHASWNRPFRNGSCPASLD